MDDPDRIVHLRPASPSWPAELGDLDAPPEELWARGQLAVLAVRPRVAVVGSRSPTPYGIEQAGRFGREFARAGACVVSGMARGVDHAAHEAALAAGGATVAVLGSGVDRPWPRSPLVDRLLERGLLLSEHPPGQGPRPHHFPLRNRILAGLARAVVVVEAAATSGSLITARWAADQGCPVYALPGRVDHPLAQGTLRLLREGAAPVGDPAEVLAELGLAPRPPGLLAGERAPAPEPTSPAARAVRAALVGETLGANELALRLERPIGEVLVALVELEMAGLVARGPGGLFRLRA